MPHCNPAFFYRKGETSEIKCCANQHYAKNGVMTLKYYFELVQLNDYSRLIESKIKVLVYMSTKLASDDVYSKTS